MSTLRFGFRAVEVAPKKDLAQIQPDIVREDTANALFFECRCQGTGLTAEKQCELPYTRYND